VSQSYLSPSTEGAAVMDGDIGVLGGAWANSFLATASFHCGERGTSRVRACSVAELSVTENAPVSL